MNALSSKLFTWSTDGRSAIADLTDIQHGFHQIYDDAYDMGFKIMSKRTNKEKSFVLRCIDTQYDTGVLIFKEERNKRIVPGGITINVVND